MLVALRGGLPDKCQIAFALFGWIFSEAKTERMTESRKKPKVTILKDRFSQVYVYWLVLNQ